MQTQTSPIMLIKFDTKQNCNKFYEITLLDDNTVQARYGRVGNNGQFKKYSGGQGKVNSLYRSKLRGGYKLAEVEVQSSSGHHQINAIDVALQQIKYQDDASKAFIRTIAESNIHNIVGNTNITFDKDDGLFKTPLGIVKRDAVLKAMSLLDDIDKLIKNGASDDKIFDANEAYFFIIPNKVKNARLKEHLLFTHEQVDKQRQICGALIDTLELLEELKAGKKKLKEEAREQDIPEVFDVEVEHLQDKKMIHKIVSMYEDSKNSMHGHTIARSKVSNIYKIKLGSQQEAFQKEKEKIGNVQLLWHGSRIANLLSIMSKGLLTPSESPGAKVGAMFGPGLYFANQSSKSLQYCDGLFWSTSRQKTNKVYLFLASVAMGKYQVPSGMTKKKPSAGYHSYWAKAGQSGVRNDEIIVFNPAQVRLDYIVEISI